MWEGYMVFRRPSPDEARLLKQLATLAGMDKPERWLGALLVRPMEDGGMGSLQLSVDTEEEAREKKAVTCKAAVQFKDEDGVEVIASLNAREDGAPFELDIWKTDFSPLMRIPDDFKNVAE
jgi:hypothetical protein